MPLVFFLVPYFSPFPFAFLLSPRAKKLLNELAAFSFQHAGRYLDVMIQEIRVANTKAGLDRPASPVARAENKPPHPRLNQSPGTHCAGLDRGIDNRISEPVVINLARSFAQRDDLGVRGRVSPCTRTVACQGNQRFIDHNAGTDGHLTALLRLPGCCERLTHPVCVNLSFGARHTHRRILPSNNESQTIGTALSSVKRAIFRIVL